MKRLRPLNLAWMFVLLGLFSSCGTEEASLSQAELLADYREGFERLTECVADAGGEVRQFETSPSSGEITYGILGLEDSVSGPAIQECVDEFAPSESRFQLESEAVQIEQREQLRQVLLETVNPCLERNGLPPLPLDDLESPESLELTRQFEALEAGGSC